MKEIIKSIFLNTPLIKHIFRTQGTSAPITVKSWFYQKILGFNRSAYWPTHPSTVVHGVENIRIGIGTAPGLSQGCYITGNDKLEIGDYTIIAPNVGLITANHDKNDYRIYHNQRIKIGKYCWIGMNAVILPGVILGNHTIVGANAVVTTSFPNGYCVIAGNPAKEIKKLDKRNVIEYKNKFEYIGYIPKKEFNRYRKKYLKI